MATASTDVLQLASPSLLPGLLAAATDGERWDPPWLAILVVVALVLVALAVVWWVLLVARMQDRLKRDDTPGRS